MNRERAKELLPIIQAFAEGKDINCQDLADGQWHKEMAIDPHFDDDEIVWRIKPELFECWVNAKNNGMLGDVNWGSEEEAKENRPSATRIIHMREVE